MDEMFLLKYIWVLFVFYGAYNLFNYYKTLKGKEYDVKDKNKFIQALVVKFLLFLLPWIVMGIGTVIGRVGHFILFFAPFTLNPYAIAFGAVYVGACIVAFIWLNYLGGIEYLYESKVSVGFLIKYMHLIIILLYIGLVIFAYILIYKTGFSSDIK